MLAQRTHLQTHLLTPALLPADHEEKWLVGPRGQPGVAFSALVRDIWSASIGLARLKALQATAAAAPEAEVDATTAPAAPSVRLRATAAVAAPPVAASEPFQPAYRALPAASADASSGDTAAGGSGPDAAAEAGWLEGGLTVAGAAYDMMPSVHTVASMVSIAGSLGSTATGAAELTAGAVVGAAGTVATAALGAPGSVATAVAGAAVSAAATASKVSLGAVSTAANLVVVGAKVAELAAPAPAPAGAGGGGGGGGGGGQAPAAAGTGAGSSVGAPRGIGLPPALLPAVPTRVASGGAGEATEAAAAFAAAAAARAGGDQGGGAAGRGVQLQPPPTIRQLPVPAGAAAAGVVGQQQDAAPAPSRLPGVAAAFADVRDMLPEMPVALGGRPASAYEEI